MIANSVTLAMVHVAYERHPEDDEPGCICYQETKASVKRRISALFGFKPGVVKLLEASMTSFCTGSKRYYYYDSMQFSVYGLGYSTNFETLVMAPEYNG